MTFCELLPTRYASLQSPAAPAQEPGRPPSVLRSTTRRRHPARRHSLVVPCSSSSGPQQWRTVPTHQQYGTPRRPTAAPADGGGGLPGPVAAAGWVLAAMVAFNFLRAIVLMWVRRQPRRPPQPSTPPTAAPDTPAQAPAATAPAAAPAPAAPGEAAGRGPVPGPQGAAGGPATPASAESGPATSASTPFPSSAAAMPGLAVSAASARPQAPPLEDTATASASASGRAAAASESAAAAATEPTVESGGGSLQVANYQLRPRGSKSSNNLGRVVLCATLDPDPDPGSDPGPGPGSASGFASRSASRSGSGLSGSGNRAPWRAIEWHQRFWQPLISKYADTPEDRVTGLLLLYGNSVLHILEGDNNQLFALLRELRPREAPSGGTHRLQQIRVPCYILDLRERLFDQWMCAAAQRPTGRSRALRAALRAPAAANDVTGAMGVGMAKGLGIGGATVAGLSGDPLLPPLPGADGIPGSTAAAPPAPPPDQQLVSRIQQLELFVKFVGPKLSALATQEALNQALRNLHDFETTTPPEDVVASLATDPLAPALHDFVNSFDADYHRYVSLLALVSDLEAELEAVSAGDDKGDAAAAAAAVGRGRIVARAASLAGEIRHLARFYDAHVKRDLKEAMAQREEEVRSRGADEVARRLSRGMRLRVGSHSE